MQTFTDEECKELYGLMDTLCSTDISNAFSEELWSGDKPIPDDPYHTALVKLFRGAGKEVPGDEQ